ncbi:YjbQ family protein [filamentous cyanobacterium LEGE 11480]|uniref:YjbQ family protein n=1 Tax=Romeriopsis navalis LEGE 11480 TaxID=2777977 RepID=A0A928VTN5_9CYAN|nr:secondary thiamine-phosphate synthase enzyme YjbQ [Romeriopsis navalis]MBE9032347.1 YjbQ family protein [Romeriopsis navalis LEGE 11480]
MIKQQIFEIPTQDGINLHNLNQQVQAVVAQSEIQQGQVLIFSRHTTTAIVVNEDEVRLLDDIQAYLEKLAPPGAQYLHNDLHLRPDIPSDEPMNAHSHLMAMTLGNCETVPVIDGQLALGTYQAIMLVELDGPRDRTVFCQVMGEV